MRRRYFLAAASGLTAGIAGCSGQVGLSGDENESANSSDSDAPAMDNSRYQTLPDLADLVDTHRETVASMTFVAEERYEEHTMEGDDQVEERTVRSGETGLRIETPSGEEAWFTSNRAINPDTHRYNPDGIEAPVINEYPLETVRAFETERVAVDEDDRTYVFESTGVRDELQEEADATVTGADLRVAIHESGYIRSLTYSVSSESPENSDRTYSASYEYEITETGDVTVSEPSFVDDALRIEGSLDDHRWYVLLEHTGGETISAGTQVRVHDAHATAETEFPTDFAPGDRAYVYWTEPEDGSESSATVDTGHASSTTYRTFAYAEDDFDSDPLVSGADFSFVVAFGEPE